MKRSAAAMAGGALAVLPVGESDFQLRLLRVAPVGIARLELLEELDGLLVVLVADRVLRLAVELLRRPADGLVVGLDRGAASQRRRENGDDDASGGSK